MVKHTATERSNRLEAGEINHVLGDCVCVRAVICKRYMSNSLKLLNCSEYTTPCGTNL